jgi:hypothetical protein
MTQVIVAGSVGFLLGYLVKHLQGPRRNPGRGADDPPPDPYYGMMGQLEELRRGRFGAFRGTPQRRGRDEQENGS